LSLAREKSNISMSHTPRTTRALFLDRDGVINVRVAPHHYITSVDQFRFLPGAIEALKALSNAGYELFVITNQAGVAQGHMTADAVAAIHAHMNKCLAAAGVPAPCVYVCMHGYDGCECRKPKPGLLLQAAREHNLDLTHAIFIGDDVTDAEVGAAAGVRTILVASEIGVAGAVPQLLDILSE